MSDYTFDDLPAVTLRGRQQEWIDSVNADLETGFTRMLFCASGGAGKTLIMGAIAREQWEKNGIRSLITVNRKSIVQQTARRMVEESGIECSVEMGDETASPYSPCVVASVQSLSKMNRLTGFADNHFGFVFPDEAHINSVSPGALRINNYFHYGAESLLPNWVRPKDGTYQPKATVIGFTATPEDKLMEWYQHITVKYPYFQAVQDGVLVPVIQKSIPVKIDLRRKKVGNTTHGRDFNDADLTETLEPVIEEIAAQVVEHASDRKTICFLPSVNTAKMLAEALARRGMKASFVSGDCDNIDEKTEAFRAGGAGYVACCAMLWNYGIDFPDVDCVGWFRATISKSFFLQGVFRASRVLPGVIDGMTDAMDRRRAIAASRKSNFLLLDPLFVTDRADICDAYDLFTEEQGVKDAMKKKGVLSAEAAEKAERDFVKSLEKAARKVANRQAKTYDPLEWGVSIGIERLKDFKPEREWESLPVSPEQKAFLKKHQIALTRTRPDGTEEPIITCKGQASLVIGVYLKRLTLKLARPGQLEFLSQLGLADKITPTLSAEEAGRLIDERKRAR